MADETQPSLADELKDALQDTIIDRSPKTSSKSVTETSPTTEAPASAPSTDNAQAPAAPAVTDLSSVPEQFRSEFTNASSAAQEFLRNGVMMRADYNKKTAALADKTRLLDEQMEQMRQDAILWRRLQADKDLMKHLSEFVSARSKGQPQSKPVEEEEEDLDYLDPAKMKAWRLKVREEAKQEALQAFEDRYLAPQRRQNEIGEIMKAKFIGEMGLDPELVYTAAELAGVHAQKFGINVTSANVIDLVNDFLDVAKSKTNKSTPQVSPTPFKALEVTAPVQRRVATPTPSMAGGIAPPTAPSFKREGRAPEGRDDYHAAVLDQLGKAWGQEVTEADLKSILNDALTPGV